MRLRILGAHNMESRDTRLAGYLVDDVIALDAGSLTRSLSFEEQRGIRAVLLSHRHFDHVRDLLPLGLVMRNAGRSVELYAIRDTGDYLCATLLSGKLYPDFLSTPSPDSPTYRLHVVEFYQKVKVLERYAVMAAPVPHGVPAAGFQVSDGRASLFYTGDATRGLGEAWQGVSPDLDLLLAEVTFGDENSAGAAASGHLTPAYLAEELERFKSLHGRLPKVVVTHMNPPWEAAIRQELKAVAERLGADIEVGSLDMTVTV